MSFMKRRVSSAIQNRPDFDLLAINPVVNCERKSPGEAPMQTENHRMNSTVKTERIDIG